MKSVYITLLVVLVAMARAQDRDCPDRNENAAKAEDPTRKCRRACSVTADCTGPNKQCLCDDLCGLSCYNPGDECPSLEGTLENGSIKTRKGVTYGGTAKYTCNIGYYRTGIRERICRSTREWSHTPAYCTKGCFNPTTQNNAFANVDWATGFAVGTIVTYECRTGYQVAVPDANMDVTCQSDFTWSALQFECVRKNCGHPGTIDNGYLEGDNFDFGQRVTYKCDPGYKISGRTKRWCFATGEWSPKEPLPVCNNLALARAQDEDCPDRNEDAAKAEDPTRKCRRACSVTADCTGPNKRCLCDDLCGLSCYNPGDECPSLEGTLENGSINTRKGLTYGSTATYTCNIGYYRTGVRERICRSTRAWSHTPAYCKKRCRFPITRNNGFANVDLATGFAVGTVVTYECRSGYQVTVPDANMDVTCQSDFTWTPVQFECARKNCGHPGTIDNGYLEGDNFDFGQFVIYKCDPGYKLSGRAARSCSATGEWSPYESLPECNRAAVLTTT